MPRRHETRSAVELAAAQRDISVAEFFARNRHLLGFDSPDRALLTAVKEAVDNALDACEDAGTLPTIFVDIEPMSHGVYKIAVEDDGPGIAEKQVARIFGKLLYGSKFHRLAQSRGQQGMGISAAGMYAQMTTGEPTRILSRAGRRAPALEFEVSLDTKRNRPKVHSRRRADWTVPHGTRVELTLEGRYHTGLRSVDEYLRQTALANPHATIRFEDPNGHRVVYARSTHRLPRQPVPIKPHPHGLELGTLIGMLHETRRKTMGSFLQHELSRVGARSAAEILHAAGHGLESSTSTRGLGRSQVRALQRALVRAKVSAPSSDCLAPIGEASIRASLASQIDARFYTARTRPPAVYRGNPFQIEVGLAWGRPREATHDGSRELLPSDAPARVIRLANRVPLLFAPGGCAITQAVLSTNWHGYGVDQSRGGPPIGPLAIFVHVASVWVPFTSEAKEAVASYPEIEREIMLGLRECGRRLAKFLAGVRREREARRRHERVEHYLPQLGIGMQELLDLPDAERDRLVEDLHAMFLERWGEST